MVLGLQLDPSCEIKTSRSIAHPSFQKCSLHAAVDLYGFETQSHGGDFSPYINIDPERPYHLSACSECYSNQLTFPVVQNGLLLSCSGSEYFVEPAFYCGPSLRETSLCGNAFSSIVWNKHKDEAESCSNSRHPDAASRTEDDSLVSEVHPQTNCYGDDLSQLVDDKAFRGEFPNEHFPLSNIKLTWGGLNVINKAGIAKRFLTYRETECLLIQSFVFCVGKLIRLEGSRCLFSKNGGFDEEVIKYFAIHEKLLDKDDPFEESHILSYEGGQFISLPFVPYCREYAFFQARLVSFGVWCVHRILDLLLVENRPEILNRLQGMVVSCKCLQSPEGLILCKMSSGGAQATSRSFIIELIKNVEVSVLGRKGLSGTRRANIAYPKGKENVASVLKCYKRRLLKSWS